MNHEQQDDWDDLHCRCGHYGSQHTVKLSIGTMGCKECDCTQFILHEDERAPDSHESLKGTARMGATSVGGSPHIVVWKRTYDAMYLDDYTGPLPIKPEKKSFRVGTLEEVMETQPDGEGWELDECYPVEMETPNNQEIK